jgi:nuclear GTP-binding protein
MSSAPRAPKVQVKEKARYFQRSAKKEKMLKMYNSGGKLSHEKPDTRIAPNRKWFGNNRTITQEELASFQNAYKEVKDSPNTVILHRRKLPTTLVEDVVEDRKFNLLQAESFQNTFGKNAQRRKPNLSVYDLKAMMESAKKEEEDFHTNKTLKKQKEEEEDDTGDVDMGQTKRVMGEVYKVIDSSDVVVEVLDARDPMATRSKRMEEFMVKETPHKHLVFLINKVDLVPRWVVEKAIRRLSRERPTLAYRASTTVCFGYDQFLSLLKQYQVLHSDRAHTCVGFVGYPNVGKSSVINSLRKEEVCPVAPIPGETKVWRYISLTRKIYLIDCPGHVYPDDITDADRVLRGVTRTERIKEPEHYIDYIVSKVRPQYIMKTYNIDMWTSIDDLINKVAIRFGRLGKGGIPDTHAAAIRIITDFQRGRIPWFIVCNSQEKALLAPKKAAVKVTQPDLSTIQPALNFTEEDLKGETVAPEIEEQEKKLDEEAAEIIGEAPEIIIPKDDAE